jgi:hypothetical protein
MKPRKPNTVHESIQRIYGALTLPVAATAVGKSGSHVYRWGNPDADSLPNIEQAMALDMAFVAAGCGSAPILDLYRTRIHGVTAPPHTAADPRDRLASIMKEIGDVAGEVRASIDSHGPGGAAITPTEASSIAGEAQEAINALRLLIADLDVDAASRSMRETAA